MTAVPSIPEVDLTVSIANRNGREFVRGCIESICSGTRRITYEIVVVDNNSTDGSVELLRDRFPSVRVIANEVSKGYGASHNQAFEVAHGRHFLVLNNDMTVRDGALDAMIARIDRGDNIGLLGCRLSNPDGTLQVSCGRESTVLRAISNDLIPAAVPLERVGLREWMRNWNHDSERDVDVVQGSCMLLPRKLFADLGGFDESFEFFREEFDLCKRVRAAGKRVVFFPDAEIVHFGGQTMRAIPIAAFQNYLESRYRYFAKYNGRLAARVVMYSAFFGIAMRWAVLSVLLALGFERESAAREKRELYSKLLRWFVESARPWAAGKPATARGL